MECLKGYIGLRGCGTISPLSNRYVNSLPGISLKGVDNMANQEKVTYAKVWQDVEERATADFSTKVAAKFAERFRLKKVLENIDLGDIVDAVNNQTAPAAHKRGFLYELTFEGSHYKPSALQMVYVTSLKLYLKAAGNVTVEIIDVDRNKIMKSIAVTGVEGWNTIPVNECYHALRLAFVYDATSVSSVYQELTDFAHSCCASCTSDIYGDDCTANISGVSIVGSSVVKGQNIFGLSGEIALLCSFDNVVCKNKKVFELAYWYKLGEEIMIEGLASSRFNITTIDKKELQELQGFYSQKFDEELSIAIKGIDLDLNDCCLECNAPVTYQESRM